jgi:hypothetical protein
MALAGDMYRSYFVDSGREGRLQDEVGFDDPSAQEGYEGPEAY